MYGRPRSKATAVKTVEDLSDMFWNSLNKPAGVWDMPKLTGPEALEELRVSEGYADLPTASPLGSFVPELVSLFHCEKRADILFHLSNCGASTGVKRWRMSFTHSNTWSSGSWKAEAVLRPDEDL